MPQGSSGVVRSTSADFLHKAEFGVPPVELPLTNIRQSEVDNDDSHIGNFRMERVKVLMKKQTAALKKGAQQYAKLLSKKAKENGVMPEYTKSFAGLLGALFTAILGVRVRNSR